MRRIIKEIIPAQEERTIEKEKYYCDICGEEIENPINIYNVNQGRIFYNDNHYNSNYGDGGYADYYCFHLCNECIKNKVFPLIEQNLNIESRFDEKDW